MGCCKSEQKVGWMEWMDTPYTVMATKAPAVLINFMKTRRLDCLEMSSWRRTLPLPGLWWMALTQATATLRHPVLTSARTMGKTTWRWSFSFLHFFRNHKNRKGGAGGELSTLFRGRVRGNAHHGRSSNLRTNRIRRPPEQEVRNELDYIKTK